MRVGTVRSIYRYPVKSMGGEEITNTLVGLKGLAGDRGWVVRDETTGRFGTAKRIPALFSMSARYMFEPEEGVPPPPAEITLPDGWKVRSDNPSAAARVGEALEREITLWPTQPPENEEFYLGPPNPDPESDLRTILGLEDGESFPPGVTAGAANVRRFMAPLGTYFDGSPLHIVTTTALETLRSQLGETSADVRRFRPNFVIDTQPGSEPMPEFGWSGKRIKIGSVVIEAVRPTLRCAMVTMPQPGLDRDTPLLRYFVRETNQDFGLYLRVLEAGRVEAGDAVEVE